MTRTRNSDDGLRDSVWTVGFRGWFGWNKDTYACPDDIGDIGRV